ncbi:MAG: tetratricopeptide repeat protein [Deltaproteobacteria bacterium]|nr:tetratricopeptide repeat protein [Deltaproteobacteria bacterium]
MTCLDDNTVAAWLHGGLNDEERAEVEQHLAECAECLELVTTSSRLDGGTGGELTEALKANANALLARGSTVGRYLVLDCLGVGGTAVVYRAWDPDLARHVALKLIAPADGSFADADQAREHLLREAQGLARLSHPHIVTVHDVGTHAGQVYVAMEHCEEGSLRAWLAREARRTREVIAAFLQAGAGLAAAHEAGLVHRDFKLDNVLVASGGRICVADFGLASPAGQRSWGGTLGYMAPEQLRGEASDERCDQFAFCVALFEALAGSRPFTGETAEELLAAMSRGPAPRPARVPPRVYRALQRGLALKARDRFPSLPALLGAVRGKPLSERRAFWAAAALALSALGVHLLGRDSAAVRCLEEGAAWSSAWDDGRRSAVHAAFHSTALPFAEASLREVDRSLTRYGVAWSSSRVETCVAAARGAASSSLLDARIECLDRLRADAEALTGVLSQADARVVEGAPVAVSGLEAIAVCAAAQPEISSKRAPAFARERAEALRRRLAEIRARSDSGDTARALELAEALLPEARTLGWAPVVAEAQWALARALTASLRYREAIEAYQAAVVEAQRGSHDRLVAASFLGLAQAELWQQQVAFAKDWVQLAEATSERAGTLTSDRPALAVVRSRLLLGLGSFQDAVAEAERAVGLTIEQHGPDGLPAADALAALAMALHESRRLEEAAVQSRRVMELRRAALGEDHPLVAMAVNNLGYVRLDQGRFAEAMSHFQDGRAMLSRTVGLDNVMAARLASNLGVALMAEGRAEEAVVEYRGALELFERHYGPDHTLAATAIHNLAGVLDGRGQHREALELELRATAIRERAFGPEHPRVASSLAGAAIAYLGLAAPAKALPLLERALRIVRAKPPGNTGRLGQVEFALARALWDLGEERERAHGLAVAAKEHYAEQPGEEATLKKVEEWLVRHPRPPHTSSAQSP